jgi:hypothetical protein
MECPAPGLDKSELPCPHPVGTEGEQARGGEDDDRRAFAVAAFGRTQPVADIHVTCSTEHPIPLTIASHAQAPPAVHHHRCRSGTDGHSSASKSARLTGLLGSGGFRARCGLGLSAPA